MKVPGMKRQLSLEKLEICRTPSLGTCLRSQIG